MEPLSEAPRRQAFPPTDTDFTVVNGGRILRSHFAAYHLLPSIFLSQRIFYLARRFVRQQERGKNK